MKQLLLAAALIGMSAAALAAEPVALTDSQLDNVTAGQDPTVVNAALPVAFQNLGITIGVLGTPLSVAVLPTNLGSNLAFQAVSTE
jgi:urea transporter